MIWLLDVNALIALGHGSHLDHERVHSWFASLLGSSAEIATCAITELGFVRVSVQAGYEEAESSMRLATLDKGIPGAFLIPS